MLVKPLLETKTIKIP